MSRHLKYGVSGVPEKQNKQETQTQTWIRVTQTQTQTWIWVTQTQTWIRVTQTHRRRHTNTDIDDADIDVQRERDRFTLKNWLMQSCDYGASLEHAGQPSSWKLRRRCYSSPEAAAFLLQETSGFALKAFN